MAERNFVTGRFVTRGPVRYLAVEALFNSRTTVYRLVVNTAASHVTLLPEIVADLDLPLSKEFVAIESQSGSRYGQLHHLESIIVGLDDSEIVMRRRLHVVSDDLPRGYGADGFLGMQWLQAYSRVTLDLNIPGLEIEY